MHTSATRRMSDGAFLVVVLLAIAALLAVLGVVLARVEAPGVPLSVSSLGTGALGVPSDVDEKTAAPDARSGADETGASQNNADQESLNLSALASTYAHLASDAERTAQVQLVANSILDGWQDNVSLAFVSLANPDVSAYVAADVARPSASVIKLLIIACVLDQAAQGTVDLQQQVTVSASDIVDGAGVVRYAGEGAVYTVEELARLMISQSDNVAANMLIDLVGYDAVNAEADKLGLSATHLSNKFNSTELHEAGGNNTSASDVARILQALVKGQVGSPELCQIAIDALADQQIDGAVASAVPDGVAVAHKTGWYEGVNNDAAVVFAEQPYVLVVLSEGISDEDSSALMAQASWDIYQLTNAGEK